MILYELFGDEAHPVYQELQISNGARQYDFLRSAVSVSLTIQHDFLSTAFIKALNFHAITCLHVNAGEFRPCPVRVGDGPSAYHPPEHYQVEARMDTFVNTVNRRWDSFDPVTLAAFVLWQLNLIHPFINGNGRTARAASYFALCLKLKQWLPGKSILPELISRNRDAYVVALKSADQGDGLVALHALLSKLLGDQLASAGPPPPPPIRRFNKSILQARHKRVRAQ
jgi:fido (protein-threonine AMPylation protein)